MIKKVRIAVDHGNRNMKTCSRVFTTGLTIQDKKPARGEKFLFYEGKYYVLSENRIPYQRDKTHDDRFFILTLFAIVKVSQRMSFRWIFRLGCHPSIMQNFVNGMKHILKDKGKSMISITVVGHIISPLER